MKQEAVISTTHLDRHFMRLTKGALEKAAQSINEGRRLLLTIEHDVTIPPYGKSLDARVELRDDGEYQLVVTQEVFEDILWASLQDGTPIFKQESESDRYPFADRYEDIPTTEAVLYDYVNFASKEALGSFINDIKSQAGIEVETGVFGRKSFIPDPEFIIRISQIIVTYLIGKKVMDKVVDKVGDKLIDLAVEDITKFYSFVKSVIKSAVKYAQPSGRPITYIFVAPGNPTVEFVVRSADTDLVISAMLLEKLEKALSQANYFYESLGAVRIQYLLSEKGEWQFNYLLTGTGAVIGTERSLHQRRQRIEMLIQASKEKGDSEGSQDTTKRP